MSISLLHLETAPQCCPTCDGELYVTASEPRSGAECPFCRTPLWFLQKLVDDVVILTFLPEGKKSSTISDCNNANIWILKKATRSIVNLSRLTTVSSAFLDMLVGIAQKLESVGGALKLCSLRPEVAKLIEDADLGVVFEIYSNEETALESFDQTAEDSSMILPLKNDPFTASPSGDLAVQA